MIKDWKYQVSLALPEGVPDAALSSVYDIVEAALNAERERCAKIVQDSDFGEAHKTVQRKLADVIRGNSNAD